MFASVGEAIPADRCAFCGNTEGPLTRVEGLFAVLTCPACLARRARGRWGLPGCNAKLRSPNSSFVPAGSPPPHKQLSGSVRCDRLRLLGDLATNPAPATGDGVAAGETWDLAPDLLFRRSERTVRRDRASAVLAGQVRGPVRPVGRGSVWLGSVE